MQCAGSDGEKHIIIIANDRDWLGIESYLMCDNCFCFPTLVLLSVNFTKALTAVWKTKLHMSITLYKIIFEFEPAWLVGLGV